MSDRTAPTTSSAHRAERDNPLVARAKATPVRIIVDVHERQSGIAETCCGRRLQRPEEEGELGALAHAGISAS
jgi:hypothetical protein